MTQYKPLVRVNGKTVGLPIGDSLDAVAVPLAAFAQTVAFASSVTLDVALYNSFEMASLAGNIRVNFSHAAAGRKGSFWVKQDVTGGRRVGFAAPAGFTIYSGDLNAAQGSGAITRYDYAMTTDRIDIDVSVRTQSVNTVVSGGEGVTYAGNRVVTA